MEQPIDYPERGREVGFSLMGTCRNIDQELENRGWEGHDLNMDFCLALDDVVFCCAECGWWCEISEAREHGGHSFLCDQCYDENNEPPER